MPIDIKIYGHQFVVNGLVYEYDSNFSALLNKTGSLYRRYDRGYSKQTVNEYGEVVESITGGAPEGKFILSFKCRVVKLDVNVYRTFVEEQGDTLLSEHKVFCRPDVPIQENDEIRVLTEVYQVMRVDKLYKKEQLHHLELSVRRLDLT